MAATVTLVYKINAFGQKTPAQLAVSMEVPQIPPDALTLLAVTVTSDSAAVVGTAAVRTIVLDASSPAFLEQFPDDQVSPFKGLMVGPIAEYVNTPVVESLPVFSP